jgi:hypothetical protein
MCDFSFVRHSARLPFDPRAAYILSGEIGVRHLHFTPEARPALRH